MVKGLAPMWIGIVSLFPEMFDAIADYGITGRAVADARLKLGFWNPRDYATDKHRTVDDRPYGGGPGMVMMYTPLKMAVDAARQAALEFLPGNHLDNAAVGVNEIKKTKVIYLSPQGRRLDQRGAEELAALDALILVAGRYEGVDQRFIENEVDEEWSIGDFVLSGGELAAMVLIDSVSRLLPGVLGCEQSALQDSFSEGLLDCPHYTRPEQVAGQQVPAVLLSGDHEKIRLWRLSQALGRTWQKRPDLLGQKQLTAEEQGLLDDFISKGNLGF